MTTIRFLGGLGEVGRNCMVVEGPSGAVIVDAGVMFPDSELVGVDLVLPEFTYIEKIADRVAGIVLTHGHEDHIGAMPYLLPRIPPTRVYGSDLTLRFLSRKLDEFGIADAVELRTTGDRQTTSIAGMDFTFFATAHSVPDACGIVIESDDGRILHTGDFKIDSTPLDQRRTDLQLIARVGERGVDVMLCDSTNAVERGWIKSERQVGRFFEEVFGSRRQKRIIATCFASHLHRIQQLVSTAAEYGRKVCFVGKSVERNVEIAVKAGKLVLPEESVISVSELGRISPWMTCIVCTGSQGEPYSSLALMASGEHPAIEISPGDTILVSSHPIPGNEPAVYRVIDMLYAKGAEVLYSEVCPEVHVSGHAASEDLKIVISLASPRHFTPIHGEHRHLVAAGQIAQEMGVPPSNVMIGLNGDSLVLEDGVLRMERSTVPAGIWYVDSGSATAAIREDHLSHEVLRERSQIAREGVVVVVVTVSAQTGELMGEVEVEGRGVRNGAMGGNELEELKAQVASAVEETARRGVRDWGTLKRTVRSTAGQFLRKSGTGRPLVVPVVIEV
ncbi:MAG: ribonuclease J [Acidimicrobiia bacterium]